MTNPESQNETTSESAEEAGTDPSVEQSATDAPVAGNAAETPEVSAEQQLADLAAERDQFKDQWMRTLAELDNYRKRTQKEADDTRKYQSLPLVRDLLSGVDNLRRALAAASKSASVEDLLKGVEMVAKQFDDVFDRYAVKRIEAVGQPFDPNLHEAVQQLPSAEHPPMTVTADFEPGYTLHDRVVRPSKVVVSSGPPAEA